MRQVLKYPGSKWKIAGQLAEFIPPHHSYVEPFFGSGALLFNKPSSAIETINDLDHDVVNLFSCIQEDAGRLARLIMTIPFSREIYDSAFELEDSNPEACREDSYRKALVFLIKCWQGHGFRTNGYKVGWKNDVQGRERMYALWNWYRLPEWVMDIAERLRKVQIENRPALEVIERFNYSNVFQYWDPPYVWSTRNKRQYKYEMSDSDHEELLKKALQSKSKIMISGYESDMYNDYLKGWHKEYFKSSAEHSGTRQEVVWMNYMRYKQVTIFDMLEGLP
ncbi:MAG: DNA adenine methylase [Lachnospiraceae bacterium]|nr:DNA adenine methylase [Lachnospiraceae bacterium]